MLVHHLCLQETVTANAGLQVTLSWHAEMHLPLACALGPLIFSCQLWLFEGGHDESLMEGICERLSKSLE